VTALCCPIIEHHTIPAEYLTPAAPRGKGEKCLVIKGQKAGQVHTIKECRTKKWQVVLDDSMMLPFDNVCWVVEARP